MNPMMPPDPADLKGLTSRCIDRSYDSLYNLTTSLPNTPSEERRDVALKQLHDTYATFKKLLVLTRWSVQSPLTDKCAELLQEAQTFQDQANETNDRLYFLHRDLDRAKERKYDLTTAIDVLYGGTYNRLPRVINYAMHPREFPPVDEEASIAELDAVLRFRLIEETIPDKFTDINVQDGFVTAHAAGEFDMVFTVDGTKPESLWLVASVHTVLTDPTALATYKHLASTSSLRIIQSNAPTDTHYMQLKILIQKRLNHSTTPLLDACNIMADFCCSLALRILDAQGQLLVETRWPHGVSFVNHDDVNTLDIVYWTDNNTTLPYVQSSAPGTFSIEEMRTRMHPDSLAYPTNGCSLRLQPSMGGDSPGLFSLQLFPAPPAALLKRYPTLLDRALAVPANLFSLSADHFLLGSMQVHAASALFCLERHLLVDDKTVVIEGTYSEQRLTTGTAVLVARSPRTLRLSRVDSTGRTPLEVSWDLRTGRFCVFCLAKAPSVVVAVRHLEILLQTRCKVQLPGVTVAGELSLTFLTQNTDSDKTTVTNDASEVVAAVAAVLRQVVASELVTFASSCSNMHVARVRDRHAAAIDSLGLSPDAIFVQLVRSKDAAVFLVVELDRFSQDDDAPQRPLRRRHVGSLDLGDEDDEYIRSPVFSVVQLADRSALASTTSVRFFERLPVVRRTDVFAGGGTSSGSRKRKRRDLPFLSALLVHMAALGHQRAHWHAIDAFARKYNASLTTSTTLSRCKQFTDSTVDGALDSRALLPSRPSSIVAVSIPFPDRIQTNPQLAIHSLEARLVCIHGSTASSTAEITVRVAAPPFAYVLLAPTLASHVPTMRGRSFTCAARPNGDLVYQSSSTNHKFQANLIDVVVANVMLHVKPMADLGRRLERTLGALMRYRSAPAGHFYAERADPFKFTLACQTHENAVARIHIEHKVVHQFPRGAFVLTSSPHHVLLPFLQDAFNSHKSSAQLLEVLERTTVPLTMLSRAMAAHSAAKTTLTGSSAEAGLENPYPTFVPSNLVLVPRSQTHLRLTYGDRCAVDVIFLAVRLYNCMMCGMDAWM
ncbi:hypothetical protein DYB32_003749 [Aphanomyces invadans]|uniref:Mediator of RNA polymerase II transcription subunit 14 n=1 Tax=Aphanomyces invadans TaxID=157072 RepID=A0A418AZN2_9STRA|nr:hypothetical protein DYB32_003749 [Aphanomyces invadans]